MEHLDHKYHWVPAAMEWSRRGGAGIYVRYRNSRNRNITVREKSSGHIWIECPDRELVIVVNAQQVHSFRPMEGNFDEFINLSPFHEESATDHENQFFMVNYTAYLNKEQTASRIRRGESRSPNTQIIADSGGFQIWRGDIDYIDPEKLIAWYNDNVDLAMILDIPSDVLGPKHFQRLAKIQAANTDILVKNKRSDLELFNVFHGNTPAEVKAFRDITERDDIKRLAIGGGYWGTVLQSIARWYGIIQAGPKYKHYHILGVQNILQTLPIMRMVTTGKMGLITSDSTTHVQNAVSKGYYFHPHMERPPSYLSIGYRGTPYRPNGFNTLACTCPVCTAVKYKDVMGAISGNPIDILMIYHNMFATQRYMRTMYQVISETKDTKELKKMLTNQFGAKNTKRSGVQEMLDSLDFIDRVNEDGLKSAMTRYSFRLPTGVGVVKSNATLFSKNTMKEVAESSEDSDAWKTMNGVAIKYESKQGVHGKKNKKAAGAEIQSVKANKGPGKKSRTKVKTKKVSLSGKSND